MPGLVDIERQEPLAACCQESWRLGNKMQKVVPACLTDWISIVASNISHKRLTIDKPMPSPRSQWLSICLSAVVIDSADTVDSPCGVPLAPIISPGPVSLMHRRQRLASLASPSPQATVIPP